MGWGLFRKDTMKRLLALALILLATACGQVHDAVSPVVEPVADYFDPPPRVERHVIDIPDTSRVDSSGRAP